MLVKLQKDQFEKIGKSELFLSSGMHATLNIYPIINQSFSGEIWVDDVENPSIAYVFNLKNTHFLIGDENSNVGNFSAFIKKELLQVVNKGHYFFRLVYANSWKNVNRDNEFEFIGNSIALERQLYKLDKFHYSNWRYLVPKGFHIVEVTNNILNSDLKNIEGLREELIYMWDDPKNFFKTGFGVCCIIEHTLAGWCLGEYYHTLANKKRFGIGIETYEEFQRKGLATLMTSYIVEMGLEEGYEIFWDCFKSNKASIKTALKVGFKLVQDYEVLQVSS